MEKQDTLSKSPDQRRTTSAERVRMMERYRASGLTRLAFSQREGISIHKLDSWLRKERSEQKPKDIRLREVPWSSTTARDWAMELISPGGWTIRRREPISVEEILRLLRAEKC